MRSRRSGEGSQFQFTPLREGRLREREVCGAARLFQFTPLREGRHTGGWQPRRDLLISIHAPT